MQKIIEGLCLETITTYSLDGKTFGSLEAAKVHLENEIGRILDSTPLPVPPRDRLAIFGAIVSNKKRLAALLSVEIETDGETFPPSTQNLLDI